MYVGRPFFGSANIVRANQQRLRIALVWMTALLLACPRVALPCGCEVTAANASTPRAEELHSCQQGCCHSQPVALPKFRVVCAIVRSQPAEQPGGFPASCPCRLQHPQRHIGLLRSAGFSGDEDAASLSFVVLIPHRQLRTAGGSRNSPRLTTSLSAQQRCSLLCRFTI